MSDAATPTGQNPEATPTTATPEVVTLTKEAHEQLARDAARASSSQRKADLYDRMMGKSNGHFKPTPPTSPPSQEEMQAAAEVEDRKAEKGLLALAIDPIYRTILDNDPTLRDLLTKNPLAVLPMFASEALDAEDAISLVKEALDKRKPKDTQPAPQPEAPKVPPTGGVNTNTTQIDEEYEAARKIKNTETAIAKMVAAKLKGTIKK